MSNREKFEAFLISEYDWAEGALNTAIFCGDDATGHYVCGEHIYDKRDCSECLFWAWRGWQAAFKASDQQLAVVVAENARLNKFIKDDCWIWDDKSEEYFDAGDCAPETPGTDAAIAKIQAQGVDAAIERLIQKFEGTGHIGVPVMVLEHFAAQLRQGAAL